MEENYSELTEEAIKRLEYLCELMGTELPSIIEAQKKSKYEKPTSEEDLQNRDKRGEAKIASPKKVKLIEGLSDKQNEKLLRLYELAGKPYDIEDASNSREEDERISDIVETISANVAARIEEEERNLKLEAEANEKPKITNTSFRRARGKLNKEDSNPERFTEPKKRNLFTRLMNRIGYNMGLFEYTEDRYRNGYITREDVEDSKNSENWFDRSLYRSVQRYEDVVEDVSVKKGWRAFQLGVLAILLATSISLGAWAKNEMNKWLEETHRVVTVDNARENELLAAQSLILQCTEDTEYEFKHLSSREMMDAALRIPVIERKKPEAVYRTAMTRFQDQELLDKILEETYGEELAKFSPEKIRDLKQLAYLLLGENEEKQHWIRDPQIVEKLKEKQTEEKEIGD